MTYRVVLYPEQPPGVREQLTALDDFELVTPSDADGVYDELVAGAPILVTFRWEDRFLQPSLRWIAGEGAGFEQYPLEKLDEAGVVLTTATGVHTVSVAEHTMGLLLALTRKIGEATRDAVDHVWHERPGTDLEGLTGAVLGLGTIGEAIAKLAKAFGMEVIGYKRNPDDYDGSVDEVFGPDDLIEVCERADVLFVVLPGGDETYHLISREALQALGPGWIVNVGRGPVVDEDALVESLTAGQLRGAGLDVFETEPLPDDSKLWDLPNVVLTPHTAGDSPRYGERWVEIFRQNLRALDGEGPWINRVVDGTRRYES
jgi:D-2-hydroxyacid dehydrogenase (NADP+)